MGSPVVRPPVVKTRALFCPGCGGTVEIRGFAHTLTAVCINCLTVLDTSSPLVAILQKLHEKLRRRPTIPLGARGVFEGTQFEVIGFQARQTEDETTIYEWNEYVLFNPFKGFRYLVEYQGHWNFVDTVKALPIPGKSSGRPAMNLRARTYAHFQSARATTAFVMGEFPWRVQVGEAVDTQDFIAPPYLLSGETTDSEVVWSRGVYMTGAQIWQTFQLKGHPPHAIGTYANQPNPQALRSRSAWRLCGWLLLVLIALASVLSMVAQNREVFRHTYLFKNGTAEPAFVTPVFDLAGRPSNVEIDLHTDLENNWAYFNLALINNSNGEAYDLGREVSYYHGADSDGSWSEGGRTDSVFLPSIPPGQYYLRVEPEMESQANAAHLPVNSVSYELVVKRDVPRYGWYFLAALLLLIPPALIWYRSHTFEQSRWLESDYGTPAACSYGAEKSR